MLLLLAGDDGGSFTVSPSLGLVLYTALLVLLAGAIVYGIVRVVARSRGDAGR